MNESRYLVRPRADGDLEDQAYYYATIASAEVGHRFLVAAPDTFSLLATQPDSCTAGIRLTCLDYFSQS